VSTLASATEGYPFVPPEWAPSVLVPLTGLVIPAVAMASLFVYIQVCNPMSTSTFLRIRKLFAGSLVSCTNTVTVDALQVELKNLFRM
jgi:photosystem I reaction center subunit VIII